MSSPSAIEAAKIGIHIPKILLPNSDTNLTKWSVIACDQYTSQPNYWDEVEVLVSENPSCLRLVAPEALGRTIDRPLRNRKIWTSMKDYLATVLEEKTEGFVLIERTLPNGKIRKGLLIALDLEHYDYEGAKTMIRTTEGTIVDRLPERVTIRREAAIELPHIMVLIDDPKKTVIDPLFQKDLRKLYDFKLMQAAGKIRGFAVEGEDIDHVIRAFKGLIKPDHFSEKYGLEGEKPFLFAMGDGNHSFAAAKVVWEEVKAAAPNWESVKDHPSRYGLAEIVNLHDESLEFEGIHRLLLGIDVSDFLTYMENSLRGIAYTFEHMEVQELEKLLKSLKGEEPQRLPIVSSIQTGLLTLTEPTHTGTAASLHSFLDAYLDEHPSIEMDYVHDSKLVLDRGQLEGNLGIFIPALRKDEFFGTIIQDGPYPRKTFSMGEADDKRFYLEARKIRR